MLQKLRISNYALISKTVIDFKKEFTVITGETGAGKSIIFGAIELLIGARSSNKILKNPNLKCIVEGVFSLNEQVLNHLVNMDLDIEEPTLDTMENLWDKIVPGGIIVFDEYGYGAWTESNAVDKFIKKYNLKLEKTQVIAPTAYIIKK